MKNRISKILVLVLTVCMVMTCLTGCEELRYREAVQRYNARQYDAAIELFHELGDYQDSKALFTASHYWAAMDRMSAGDYSEALPRFVKLGDYEDSAQRAVECKYQLALAAFDAGNYSDAENYFLDNPDYRLTPEYLRQLNWQRFYDYILENGEQTDGGHTLLQQIGDRTVHFTADPAGTLLVSASWSKNMGYSFHDDLQLMIPRDSTEAAFTAVSRFTMTMGERQIGSEQTGSGIVDLSAYTPGAALTLDSFSMIGTDNLGNSLDTQELTACTMEDAIARNMSTIWEALPLMLAQASADLFF